MFDDLDWREWNQVVIGEPALAYGRNLGGLLEDLLRLTPEAKLVVLASIDGAGDPERGIARLGCARITIESLLTRLHFTEQLDWANLYFFSEVSDETTRHICDGDLSIADAIARSWLTVRVVDDSELHVFTTSTEVVTTLTERFIKSRAIRAPLDRLDYPM